jgi:hypothetical protein
MINMGLISDLKKRTKKIKTSLYLSFKFYMYENKYQ